MRIKLIVVFTFISCSVYSQGINNLWLMGYQSWVGQPFGGINFNFTGGSLNISYQSRPINFNCTNGEICDVNGNLLFYSNGICVVNALNDTMVNGGGLNPSPFTTLKDSDGLTIPQANLIIPFPEDTTKYYLFHSTSDDYGNTYSAFYLYYSVIDMIQDSGRGAVTQKNVVLLNDTLLDGRLTACKHANGRDWWLLAHKNLSNKFFKYLITPYEIQGPFTQDIGEFREDYFGQAVFSPDGHRFAYYEPIVGDLDVMDFDRCTGDFSNLTHVDINDNASGGGAAFSPNSNVLYISSTNYVYQFDMTAADVPASQTTVAVYDGFYSPQIPFATTFYLAQIAPDGKIYINCGNGTQDIHVINYPDSVGLSCNVCQHCVHLPAYNAFTIANHPNYFLGALSGSSCDTLLSVANLPVQNSKLGLFPNPVISNSEITFTYNVLHEPALIIIKNIEGKEVMRFALPQWSSVHHVTLPKLSGGIYLARLLGSKGLTSNIKFLVE